MIRSDILLLKYAHSYRKSEQIAYSPADQKWKSCWPYLPFELLNLNEPFADHKSDLYGLGSVMYFALTGRSPFEDAIKCDNIYELRYEQLMQNVVSPSELYPDVIPPVLSDVVMKLIKWSPNERYQAASGLLADIRELIYISKSDAGMVAAATITSNADGDSTTATSNRRSPLFHVEDFPLSDDIPINMFQIPKHVLRRGYDLRVMVKSFEKVKESKTSSCLFISGGVGVGKTKFLNEAENYIIARRGVWIKTNCENQFHSPYGPISSILEEIGKSINNLPFDVRDVIVNDIMFACQGMGQVLLDLCPALKVKKH